MQKELIGVIVPVYKVEKYIAEGKGYFGCRAVGEVVTRADDGKRGIGKSFDPFKVAYALFVGLGLIG